MRGLYILVVLLAAAGPPCWVWLRACGTGFRHARGRPGTERGRDRCRRGRGGDGSESESTRTSAEPVSAYGNWSEPEVIPGTKGASSVEIGVDAAGNVVAAWLGRRRVVQVAIRSAASGRWSAPLRMRRASEYSGLSLAVAPNGAFVLAWHGLHRRRAYAVTGSVAAGARRPMAIENSSEQPEVAISAAGVATVAWSSRSADFVPL